MKMFNMVTLLIISWMSISGLATEKSIRLTEKDLVSIMTACAANKNLFDSYKDVISSFETIKAKNVVSKEALDQLEVTIKNSALADCMIMTIILNQRDSNT